MKDGYANHWKKCKYLGSMLDTNEDMKRRKSLALMSFNKLKYVLEDRKLSLEIKIQTLNALVKSVFLYNSELWTLTKKDEKKIDAFQRNLLRKIMNIKWPNKIRNEELYEKTKQTEWSKEVRKRRIRWYGHLQRLPDETPAKQALHESLRPTKRPPGRPPTNWLKQVRKDITTQNIEQSEEQYKQMTDIEFHEHMREKAQDRDNWRMSIVHAMY